MSIQLILDSGLSALTNAISLLVQRVNQSLPDFKLNNFQQWYDLNKSENVIHAHMQSLEWLYGSVYRKHSCHYFILYNFDVNKSELNPKHKESLSEFFNEVFIDQLLKQENRYPREFEKYTSPFAVRASVNQKIDLLNDQPWMPISIGSRESQIRLSILNNYYEMNAQRKWWAGRNIAFPDPLLKVSVNPNINTSPFHVQNLLYWRTPSKGRFSPFIGRASETGSDNINDPLSIARSNNVANFIKQLAGEVGEEIFLKSEGVGSKKPIILTTENLSEAAENRSVQFAFYQEHDYLHLLTPDELKSSYKENVERENENIKLLVVYGENLLKELEESARNNTPKPVFRDIIPNPLQITDNLVRLDLEFSLGMHSVLFAKTYDGDFSTLNDPAHRSLPNTPPLRQGTYDDKHLNYLPIPQIISRGKISDINVPADFRLPLSPKFRIAY